MNKIIFLGLLGIFGGLASCKTETPVAQAPGPVSTAVPAVSGTPANGFGQISAVASINAEIYLKIERQLQSPSDAAKKLVGICQVPMGTPRGTPFTTCTPVLHGDFSIPEGDLHYSKLTFTAGTADPATCAYLIFHPYYYLGSTSSAFFQTWFNSVPTSFTDCTPGKATAGCWNGPAVSMVPGFPNNRGLIFLTNISRETVNVVDSPYNQNQNSNRYTMNNKADWTAAYTDPNDFGSSYVGDTAASAAGYAPGSTSMAYGYTASHQDYSVECRDQYYDLIYALKVVMNDEDTGTGQSPPLDDFHTWP